MTADQFPSTPPLPRDLSGILVVGGSFDPPHRAHRVLSVAVAARLGSDHVLFVPANRSPTKAPAARLGRSASPTQALPTGEDRLHMLQRALSGLENVSTSRFEIDRPGPSYTVDTLEALRAALGPTVRIHLLLGSDQARVFTATWRQPDRILQLAEVVVVIRPPDTADSFRETGLDPRLTRNIVDDLPPDTASSTAARDAIASGEWDRVAAILDPPVLQFIRDRGFYREPPEPPAVPRS